MRKIRIVLLTILGIILLVFGGITWKTKYAKTEITSYSSPDNAYELVIYQIGEPEFPFGPGKCRLVLKKGKKELSIQDVILHNDGKWPGEENFEVRWGEEQVEIVVSGEEMEDVVCSLQMPD